MPARSPTLRFYFLEFNFSIKQINVKCGRDPSYDAEKLALGRIAILLVETAILCNLRPLRMHPRCGTIFLVGKTLICVDEIKI
jgi:hypothetical protein